MEISASKSQAVKLVARHLHNSSYHYMPWQEALQVADDEQFVVMSDEVEEPAAVEEQDLMETQVEGEEGDMAIAMVEGKGQGKGKGKEGKGKGKGKSKRRSSHELVVRSRSPPRARAQPDVVLRIGEVQQATREQTTMVLNMIMIVVVMMVTI